MLRSLCVGSANSMLSAMKHMRPDALSSFERPTDWSDDMWQDFVHIADFSKSSTTRQSVPDACRLAGRVSDHTLRLVILPYVVHSNSRASQDYSMPVVFELFRNAVHSIFVNLTEGTWALCMTSLCEHLMLALAVYDHVGCDPAADVGALLLLKTCASRSSHCRMIVRECCACLHRRLLLATLDASNSNGVTLLPEAMQAFGSLDLVDTGEFQTFGRFALRRVIVHHCERSTMVTSQCITQFFAAMARFGRSDRAAALWVKASVWSYVVDASSMGPSWLFAAHPLLELALDGPVPWVLTKGEDDLVMSRTDPEFAGVQARLRKRDAMATADRYGMIQTERDHVAARRFVAFLPPDRDT